MLVYSVCLHMYAQQMSWSRKELRVIKTTDPKLLHQPLPSALYHFWRNGHGGEKDVKLLSTITRSLLSNFTELEASLLSLSFLSTTLETQPSPQPKNWPKMNPIDLQSGGTKMLARTLNAGSPPGSPHFLRLAGTRRWPPATVVGRSSGVWARSRKGDGQ